MDTIKQQIEKFGSNFIVASMIPSLAFIMACMVVFASDNVFDFFTGISGWPQLFGFNLLLFIPTIIVGFTLTSLNTHILKLFEGYVFFHHFSFLTKKQKMKAGELSLERERIKRTIERVEQRNKKLANSKPMSGRKRDVSTLKTEYYAVAAKYDAKFPPGADQILPTKFGNILRASEAYTSTRYSIDAVSFWPRLFHVIPDDYKQAINETRNELSFLVNCSILASMFFVICGGVFVYGKIESVALVDNKWLILGAIISLLLAWFFNRASLISVGAFGAMIRSAYDLFRFDLLKQLRLKMPVNSDDEFYEWKNLGEFIVLGPHSLELEWLEYHHPKDTQSDTH